ncbi:MAG: M20/M25/M40 family metallo-hydrolase [Clostridia bacterium]|jgi:endoglucanase|nr:M20/M25/M40 family metallo-hydrolase [Clostridia bacterium]MBQ6000763.1 M20/M25/M40 family metallo-hydrolase [Clostridia bacterium]MBQ6059411.1 M20/M25/M40 family metallo-hydrolase [Clostridia bacterium]
MDIKQILFDLSQRTACSGMEYRCAERVKELFTPYCDEILVDALHNVLAIRHCDDEDAPTVLFDAHMDEIAMVITGIRDDGFLTFNSLAGIDRRTILAAEVTVHAQDGDYYGIVSAIPPHLSSEADRKKTPEFDTLCIDVGFGGEKAKQIFSTGDFVTLRAAPAELLGSIVTGKTFDDRASVTAILYAMHEVKDVKLPFHVCAMLSAQEEPGLRGAKVGAHRIDPQEAIAIDVCHALIPECPREKTSILGKGPVLTYAPILDRELVKKLEEIAADRNIPVQTEASVGTTGTNAYSIFASNCGVKTALISIPLKYMHSAIETLDVQDVKNVGRLLAAYLLEKKEAMTRA